MPVFPDGTRVKAFEWRRLLGAIPTRYTVFKSGATYYGESNEGTGTDYKGLSASRVIQQALDATSTNEAVAVKCDFQASTEITVAANKTLYGVGKPEVTSTSSSDAVFALTGDWSRLANFYINNTGNTTRKGVRVNGGGVRVDHMKIKGGDVGLYVSDDTSGENWYRDIRILDLDGANGYAVNYERTTTSDVGGHYFDNLHITGCPYGVRMKSTAATFSDSFFWLYNPIIDGATVYGLYMERVKAVNVFNGWITSATAATGNTVYGDQVYDVWFYNNKIFNTSNQSTIKLQSGTGSKTQFVHFWGNQLSCTAADNLALLTGTGSTLALWHINFLGNLFRVKATSGVGVDFAWDCDRITAVGNTFNGYGGTTGNYCFYKEPGKTVDNFRCIPNQMVDMSHYSNMTVDFHLRNQIIRDPLSGADGTLSGTPKVVQISMEGIPYYFKVYPTKS